ncbi:hypothetical protein PZA11_001078 [Diplocarpon coronariae]|uniref:Peroxidase n=1 Tax=Diplocarpon coronariae TaxID=2795749 RepID=A0A218YR64_9HELO|nr:peroxidase [Diplocarpon mali]OWO92954.1 peroxidase [Marssonina coronariae]
MKFTSFILGASLVFGVAGCPGQAAMSDLKNKLEGRQAGLDAGDSTELIGDLATVGATTPTGKIVKDILLGKIDPYTDEKPTKPLWAKGTTQCAADTCCIWRWIALDMAAKFRGSSGRCNRFARAAIRQGFHDAGPWNKTIGYGGADGSLILANEITRTENNGLQEIIGVTKSWYNAYKQYGVGMADLIQFGATVAVVTCPLGPRVRSFVGRKDSSRPNADNLMPSVLADANSLIALFKAKTIMPHGLTALVGAHSTSQQQFVNTNRAYDPQDGTPGVWDVVFYGQTIGMNSTPPRVFKFPSDVNLAAHPQIRDEWVKFASYGGQEDWNEDFAKEYVRLSLLGVNNINNLTECTMALPAAVKTFTSQDQSFLDTWLAGGYPTLGSIVLDGTTITSAILSRLGEILKNLLTTH